MKSKELSMGSDDEELLVFEEEVVSEEEESHEDEGPSEPIRPVVLTESRKRPN